MSRRTPRETPDPVDLHVGKRLKARRVGLRISQTDVGDQLGVTFQQIQKYENGSNRVGASNLFKLATALGVQVSYFFDEIPKVSGPASAGGFADGKQEQLSADPMSDAESIKLVHNYHRITNPTIRQQVFQLVKSMADSDANLAGIPSNKTKKKK